MTSHPTLRDLFEAAVELPPGARAAYLDEHCPDPLVRERIGKMLAADASGTPAFEAGAGAVASALVGDDEAYAAPAMGSRIGPFELVEIIGEGGSSTVFHARRTVERVAQDVALKVLHRPLYSPAAQQQFRRERQALAHLRHPGIARLIEGGVTEQGIAYIALELVKGEPITAFVRRLQLGLDQRLALFLDVCRAVDAAHRALIVHRDLKPSNVLVDGEQGVRVLDFGIAKLLDADDETQTRLPAFTPAYAAPEQRVGGPITAATDVYALGIMLGELLTGQRFDPAASRTPSGQIREDTEAGTLPASVAATRRRLRGDLDNIVVKATDPLAERRYASAAALAGDVEAFIEGRPVAAHPPSGWYRASKFVARHKGGVATSAAFLLAIFAALGIAVWQADIARHEARRANSVRDFLVHLFDSAKGKLPRDQRPTPEGLVREATRRLHDPTIDTALRADLLRTLGTVSATLDDYQQAEPLLDEALRIERESGLSSSSPEWLDTVVQKARVLKVTDRNVQADQLLADALPELRRQKSTIAIQGLLLYSQTRFSAGEIDQAFALAAEGSAKAAANLPPDSLDAAYASVVPGELSFQARRFKESAAQLEPAVARWRTLGLEQNSDFANAVAMLAGARAGTGDNVGAEQAYRESVELRRRIFEGPSDELAESLSGFAIFLIQQERFDEAKPLLEEAVDVDRKVLGPDSDNVGYALDALGTLEAARRDFGASEKALREAVRIYSANASEASAEEELAFARGHLAQTLISMDKLDEASGLSAQARDAIAARYGESADISAGVLVMDGRIALARHDPRQALAVGDRAFGIWSKLESKSRRVECTVRELRSRALEALGRREEALDECEAAIAAITAATPNAHIRLATLLALRARLQSASNHSDAAAATLAQARALNVPTEWLAPEDAATLAQSHQP